MKKWFKRAEDAGDVYEASKDPDPASGLRILKILAGYLPFGSDVVKGAVGTVETAPGGVEASRRQGEFGTINIGAQRQMSQIEW